jgi:hypothetical protein
VSKRSAKSLIPWALSCPPKGHAIERTLTPRVWVGAVTERRTSRHSRVPPVSATSRGSVYQRWRLATNCCTLYGLPVAVFH